MGISFIDRCSAAARILFGGIADAPAANDTWHQPTPEDIYYCYRLLLDRKPDDAGWQTYNLLAQGRNIGLQTIVSQFLTSTEFRLRRSARISSWSRPKLLHVGGFKVHAGPPDSLIVQALEHGPIEPAVEAVLRQHVKPGMTVLDIGANLGYLSLVCAQLVGESGRVLAFEPSQFNCTLIFMNARANGFRNIEVFPFAASDSNGMALYQDLIGNGRIHSDVTGLDHISSDADLDHVMAMSVVRTVTLDHILSAEPKIDFIKMDVEGAEYLVLRGAAGLLERHRPEILAEFSLEGLQIVSKTSGEEMLRLLVDAGYHLTVIDEETDPVPCGTDIARVIDLHNASRTNHVDVLAKPR